jgi:hypothetical protein
MFRLLEGWKLGDAGAMPAPELAILPATLHQRPAPYPHADDDDAGLPRRTMTRVCAIDLPLNERHKGKPRSAGRSTSIRTGPAAVVTAVSCPCAGNCNRPPAQVRPRAAPSDTYDG